jgi:hypothetical protein
MNNSHNIQNLQFHLKSKTNAINFGELYVKKLEKVT